MAGEKHTILLTQTGNLASRTYRDFETIRSALDGKSSPSPLPRSDPCLTLGEREREHVECPSELDSTTRRH